GSVSIRANRSGTRSGSLVAFCATRISVAPRAVGISWASALLGVVWRSARPRATSAAGFSRSTTRSRSDRSGIVALGGPEIVALGGLEGVFFGGERAAGHLVGVLGCGTAQFAADVAEPLDELGCLARGHTGHVLPHQHLGVAVGPGADADGRNGELPGDLGGQF